MAGREPLTPRNPNMAQTNDENHYALIEVLLRDCNPNERPLFGGPFYPMKIRIGSQIGPDELRQRRTGKGAKWPFSRTPPNTSTWRYSDLPLGRELDPRRTFPGFRLKVALEWTADVEPEAPEAEDTNE